MKRLIAVAAAAVTMTGCTSSPGKTIPVPEDGWTGDELSAQIYVGDKSVGFPCTLDELREQFELADASETMGSKYANYWFLRYNGESAGNVYDSDGDGKADQLHMLGSDKLDYAPLTVNGVGLGSTEKELSEHLGGRIGHTDADGETVFDLSVSTDGLYLNIIGNEKNGVKMITIEGK